MVLLGNKYSMKKILFTIIITILAFAQPVYGSESNKHRKHIKHAVYKVKKAKAKVKKPRYIKTFANVLLVNLTDNSIVNGNLDGNKQSIASISKLMTVYTVLKHNQNLDEVITITRKPINHTRLNKGMQLTRGDLIKLALVYSDNLAALTLAENGPYGYLDFIDQMNRNAKELGMTDTVFYEPTGLDAGNSSTLRDIALMTKAASNYQTFRDAAKISNLTVYATKGKKTVPIRVNSTSTMFGKEGVITIKTGFTNAAGFCITMLVNSENKLYNLVILGARSSTERKVIMERSLKAINLI